MQVSYLLSEAGTLAAQTPIRRRKTHDKRQWGLATAFCDGREAAVRNYPFCDGRNHPDEASVRSLLALLQTLMAVLGMQS
jgi:hypothetical protein